MKKFLFSCLIFSIAAHAQTELVFVYFKDKPNKGAFYANPTSELTQKSIARRAKLGIPLNDQDAPIEFSYIQNVKNLGFVVTDYSKWLNGVAVNATAEQIALLKRQPYISEVETFAKAPKAAKAIPRGDKFNLTNLQESRTNFNYGNAAAQIDQIGLRALHVSGYTGAGIAIAVIDTGFPTVDTGSAFARLRSNGQIKDGYNFVQKNTDIYSTTLSAHGTNCLGIIGGYIENTFVGSAPDADFYLYATEDAAAEGPEEELYWIEAAEEADRKGVDLISTSLGYTTFDDARYDYTYAQMDGNTSFIGRGAGIAADKGIVVVVAAGNDGQKAWHYISTPADQVKTFTIGSVTSLGNPSGFSSYGPNGAGAVKPDAAARGSATYYAYNNSSASGNGTSYATPLAAGGVACLMQAFPTRNRESLNSELRKNASLYPGSNLQIGYGILNFGKAFSVLGTAENAKKLQIAAFPNPVSGYLYISGAAKITSALIYNSLGQLLPSELLNGKMNLSGLPNGIYFVKISTPEGSVVEKIVKN